MRSEQTNLPWIECWETKQVDNRQLLSCIRRIMPDAGPQGNVPVAIVGRESCDAEGHVCLLCPSSSGDDTRSGWAASSVRISLYGTQISRRRPRDRMMLAVLSPSAPGTPESLSPSSVRPRWRRRRSSRLTAVDDWIENPGPHCRASAWRRRRSHSGAGSPRRPV